MLETLGQYRILDAIGTGGIGEVYRARDTRLGRTVAVKLLSHEIAGNAERRERFLREARAASMLSHPNIAALYEIGEDQGHLFLVFEYVPGETLTRVIAGRPLNVRNALGLAIQIADAVADAHGIGIVHRDIKPDNIIVTPKGNAKILDFGLAAWTAGGAARDAAAAGIDTPGGAPTGTVAYLSPEQALGERVDHRTDIFSIGVVVFEMLTGRPPFTGTTSSAVALQIVQAPAPLPTKVNRGLPPELDAVVVKALAKSLDERYGSAASLAAELRSVAAILDVRAGDTEPVSIVTPRARPRSRRSWMVWLLILAALAAVAWWQRGVLEEIWRRFAGRGPAPAIALRISGPAIRPAGLDRYSHP